MVRRRHAPTSDTASNSTRTNFIDLSHNPSNESSSSPDEIRFINHLSTQYKRAPVRFRIEPAPQCCDEQGRLICSPGSFIEGNIYIELAEPLAAMQLKLIYKGTDHKPRNGADCDDIVNAELPDADRYPEARATVSKSMMHGPCGVTRPWAPCMKDGVCTKGFPKTFVNETIVNEDGYPQYRRRQNPNGYVIRNGA